MPPKGDKGKGKAVSAATPPKQRRISRSKKKLGEALDASQPDEAGLHGNIPINTTSSYANIARYMAQDKNTIMKWLNSPQFRGPFEQLYKEVIAPRSDKDKTSRGPLLKQVLAAINKADDDREMKYTSDFLDKAEWDEIDHYAYTLLKLIRVNTSHRAGCFSGRQMSMHEKADRLWLAILRQTSKYNRDRKLGLKQKKLDSDLEIDVYADKPNTPVKSKKPLNLPESSSKVPARSPATSFNNPQSQAQSESQIGESSQSRKVTPQKRSSGAAGLPDSGKKGTKDKGSGLFVSSDEDDEDDDPEVVGGLGFEAKARVTAEEWLSGTKNHQNPFDMQTEYGIYMTIHSVLKHYGDDISLRAHLKGPEFTEDQTAEQFDSASRDWHNELDEMLKNADLKGHFADTAESQIKSDEVLEAFLDHKAYQPQGYSAACEALDCEEEHPRILNMDPFENLYGWQVTGIKAIYDHILAGISKGIILGDGTGLGKTHTMVGVILHIINQYESRRMEFEADLVDWNDIEAKFASAEEVSQDAVGKPENPWAEDRFDKPIAPSRPKPTLVVVMPDLCPQWYSEVKKMSSILEPWIYHGDDKSAKSSDKNVIKGRLSKNHAVFKGPNAHKRFVITSIQTLMARHGPPGLKQFRTTVRGGAMTMAQADLLYDTPESKWIGDLSEMFDIVLADEAHTLKNPDTASHKTIAWLKAKFIIMATASVVPNRVSDIRGYVALLEQDNLWSPESLAELGCDKKTNPYNLPDDHPGVVLRLTTKAVDRFVAPMEVDPATAGKYLSQIYKSFLIRRTYSSPDPQFPNRKVGSSIKSVHNRKIVTRFTDAESAHYQSLTFEAQSKLIIVKEDGSIMWNRKHLRTLIMAGDWMGFAWIGEYVMAESVAKWKKSPHLLHDWLVLLHKEQSAKGDPQWSVPERTDKARILALICRGSPKVAALLRVLSELVILYKRKLVIYSSLPAVQLLIHGICQVLTISDACFTSDATSGEREAMVKDFTTGDTMVFNGSWYVGSTGLNLQRMCHHMVFFDSAPSYGHLIQALGRLRRIGQQFIVEGFEIWVVNSFQSRIMSNTALKAVPGILAELNLDLRDLGPRDNNKNMRELTIGRWFKVGDELVEAPDPRVDHLPETEVLTPEKFVHHLLKMLSGKEVALDDGMDDEDVDTALNADLDDIHLEIPDDLME